MPPFGDNPPARRFYWRWEKALLALLPSEPCPVLAGLSGGLDSVVLARLLLASQERGIVRVSLAHINHSLRAGADADEAFVRELARDWELPLRVRTVDPAPQIAAGSSLEEAARRLRFAALRDLAATEGTLIALGHHMDDQAETVLLRLLRGTGPRGLGAMAPITPAGDQPRIIRPLLSFRRAELATFAAQAHLTWVEDETNRDRTRPRNRIRHELLPHISAEFNPRIVEAISELAHWQRLESAALEPAIEQLRRRAQLPAEGAAQQIRLDCEVLGAEPPALATRVIWRAYQELAGGEATLASAHMHQLAALLARAEDAPAQVHLPQQLRARRSGRALILESHAPRPREKQVDAGESAL